MEQPAGDRAFDPARVRYVSLATYRRSGREVRTPVWIAAVDAGYYVFTARDAGKVKRLRANGRARLAECDWRGRPLGPWIDARARLVEDPELVERAHAALRRKYGWQMAVTDFFSKLTGRYDKRAIIELRIP